MPGKVEGSAGEGFVEDGMFLVVSPLKDDAGVFHS